MKSIVVIYFFSMLIVCSCSHNHGRLYDLLRRSMEKQVDPLLVPNQDVQGSDEALAPARAESLERGHLLQPRDDWDSGEDYYFQWAKQNRRPVENLIGRKRAVEGSMITARSRRIKGGIWRSGLVG